QEVQGPRILLHALHLDHKLRVSLRGNRREAEHQPGAHELTAAHSEPAQWVEHTDGRWDNRRDGHAPRPLRALVADQNPGGGNLVESSEKDDEAPPDRGHRYPDNR